MAKELPFFKFEISEWMLGRIQKQPLAIQGTFINLCCKYWHKLGELTTVDARLDFDKEPINALLERGIIGEDGGYIFIKFLDKQLDECNQLSKKNSINGLKSAKIRAERKRALTTVEPPLTTAQPNSTEEKRREEKREEEKIKEKKIIEENVPFDELFLRAFDEMTCERLQMTFKNIPDLGRELQMFRTKCDNAPEDYHRRDVAGLRLAFQYQLKNYKNGKAPKTLSDTNADIDRIIASKYGNTGAGKG